MVYPYMLSVRSFSGLFIERSVERFVIASIEDEAFGSTTAPPPPLPPDDAANNDSSFILTMLTRGLKYVCNIYNTK